MKIAKWIAIAAAVLVGVFLAGAALLPSAYKVERTATINAPAAKIYPLIAEPKSWPRWTVWNQREPDLRMTFSGEPAGKGAKWAWVGRDGPGTMEFTDAEQDKAVHYALAFPDMGMSSTGSLRLEPAGSGTRVTWTTRGDLGGNPIHRWFGLFLDRMMGEDFEGGLANLKTLAEKP